MSNVRDIETPHGPARVTTLPATSLRSASVVLTHGAGGGIGAVDLQALSIALPAHGYTVHVVEMPWRLAGKKVAPRPAVLDASMTAVVEKLSLDGVVVLGGRSAGARVACRLADQLGVTGILALAFPLHPPGRPEFSRLIELTAASVPVLVVQGERDSFGTPQEFPTDTRILAIPAADHSLKVPKRSPVTQVEALALMTEGVIFWLRERVREWDTGHAR